MQKRFTAQEGWPNYNIDQQKNWAKVSESVPTTFYGGQCDQMRRNFDTLGKKSKVWPFVMTSLIFGKILSPLEQKSL